MSQIYALVCQHTCELSVWCCFGFVFSSESVCVCARTVWQIFKALGASELWHLLSEEELRSFSVGGWVDVCEEDTVRWDVTVLESLPEAYVIPGDKKLKELWEHIWIEEVGFSFFFFLVVASKATWNQNAAFLLIPLSYCLICQCTLFKTFLFS